VQRICQLESYLRLRYGPVLPDDDAGREDLVILLNHVNAGILAMIEAGASWTWIQNATGCSRAKIAKRQKQVA
jgi:hypothetical protein